MVLRHCTLLLLLTLFSGQAVADAAWQQSLASYIRHISLNDGSHARLIEVFHWPDTSGALHWKLPAHAAQQHPSRLSLVAEQGQGSTLRRWYVPVQLAWHATTVVASENLPARTLLTASHLKVSESNVTDHRDSWWQQPSHLLGARLTRPVKKGEAIFSASVHRPKLIQRGDLLTILVRYGAISVTAKGKALHSAALGERIPVRNSKSNKIVQGVVINASTVRIMTGENG